MAATTMKTPEKNKLIISATLLQRKKLEIHITEKV
jgi:hypothetical protein